MKVQFIGGSQNGEWLNIHEPLPHTYLTPLPMKQSMVIYTKDPEPPAPTRIDCEIESYELRWRRNPRTPIYVLRGHQITEFVDMFDQAELLVARIDTSGMPFPIGVALVRSAQDFRDGFFCVRVSMAVRDRKNGMHVVITSQTSMSFGQHEATILEQIYMAVHKIVRHEVDECFKVDGKLFRDPHPTEPH